MTPAQAALARLDEAIARKRAEEALAAQRPPPREGGFLGLGTFADIPAGLAEGAEAGVRNLPSVIDAARGAFADLTGDEAAALQAQRDQAARRAFVDSITPEREGIAGFAQIVGRSGVEMAPAFLGGGIAGLGARGLGAGVNAVRGAGLAGAAGTMFGQNYTENVGAQLDVRGADTEVNRGAAALGGAAQTGVDLLGGRFLQGSDFLVDAATAPLRQGLVRGGFRGAVKGAAGEAVAETTQQAIERAQAGLALGSEAAMDEYLQAAAAGAALGGVFGGVTGAIAERSDAKRVQLDRQLAEQRAKMLGEEAAQAEAYAQFAAPPPPAAPSEPLALPAPAAPFAVTPDGQVIPVPAPPASPNVLAPDEPPLTAEQFAQRDQDLTRQRFAELDAQQQGARRARDAEEQAAREEQAAQERLDAQRRLAAEQLAALPQQQQEAFQRTEQEVARQREQVAQERREAEARQTQLRRQQTLELLRTRQAFEEARTTQERMQILQQPTRDEFETQSLADARRERVFIEDPVSPYQTELTLRGPNNTRRAIDVLGPAPRSKTGVVIRDRETGQIDTVPRNRIQPMATPRRFAGDVPARQGGLATAGLPQPTVARERVRAEQLRARQLDELLTALRGTPGFTPEAPVPVRRGPDLTPPPVPSTFAAPLPGRAGSPFAPQAPGFQTPLTPDAGLPEAATPPLPGFESLPRQDAPAPLPTAPEPEASPPQSLPLPFDGAPTTAATPTQPAAPQAPRTPAQPMAQVPSDAPYDTRQRPADEAAFADAKTVREAVLRLKERNRHPGYAEIADAVLQRLDRLAEIGEVPTFGIYDQQTLRQVPARLRRHFGPGVGGFYARGKGSPPGVYIPASTFRPASEELSFDKIVLHEAVHAVMQLQINAPKMRGPVPKQWIELQQEATALRETVIDKARTLAATNEDARWFLSGPNNASDNAHELFTWAFTDARMQRLLDAIPMPKKRTAWGHFVDLVRKGLGMPRSTVPTALDEVLRLGDAIMRSPVSKRISDFYSISAITNGANPAPGTVDAVLRDLGVQRGDATWQRAQEAVGAEASDARVLRQLWREKRLADEQTMAALQAPPAAGPAAAKPPLSQGPLTAALSSTVAEFSKDPAFTAELQRKLQEELTGYGFTSRLANRISVAFTPRGADAPVTTDPDAGPTVTIALGLANDATDVAGAVQALRPYVAGAAVRFAQKNNLITPAETRSLVTFARKTDAPGSGQSLYDLAKAQNPDNADDAAAAMAVEYLTRRAPAGAKDTRVANAETTATALTFKDKLRRLGRALWRAMSEYNAPETAELARRLVRGDIAERAYAKFAERIEFVGYNSPTENMRALADALRARLDSIGLNAVGLRMAPRILKPQDKARMDGPWVEDPDANGAYFGRTITISLANYDPELTVEQNLEKFRSIVDHEVIHAARGMGVWSGAEWSTLTNLATTTKPPGETETYLAKAKRTMAGADANTVAEEAVAMAFADNFDPKLIRAERPRRLLDRLFQVHHAVATGAHDQGVLSPSQLLPNALGAVRAVRAGEKRSAQRKEKAGTPKDVAIQKGNAKHRSQAQDPTQLAVPTDEELALTALLGKRAFSITSGGEPARKKNLQRTMAMRSRHVPWTRRVPIIRSLYALSGIADHDQFLMLRAVSLGDKDKAATTLQRLGQQIANRVANKPALRDALSSYWLTRGADAASPTLNVDGRSVPNPSYIPDEKLRSLAIKTKVNIREMGRQLVEAGLMREDFYDAWVDRYLPHIIAGDSVKTFVNTSRAWLSDLSYTKQRNTPSPDEQILRQYVDDPVVRAMSYLTKASQDLANWRFMQNIVEYARHQDPRQAWIADIGDFINWRGKDLSPMAVETELDRMMTLGLEIYREHSGDDATRQRQTAVMREGIRTGQIALLTNPSWQRRRGYTSADIYAAFGQDPTNPQGLAGLPYEKVNEVYWRLRSEADRGMNTGARVFLNSQEWISALGLQPQDIIKALGQDPTKVRSVAEAMRLATDQQVTAAFQVLSDDHPAEHAAFVQRRDIGTLAGDALRDLPQGLKNVIFGARDWNAQYREVPDQPRYGPLRGSRVHRQIWALMNANGALLSNLSEDSAAESVRMAAGGLESANAAMKKSVTVYNPGTHMLNWVGNYVHMIGFGGIDPVTVAPELAAAVEEVFNADGEAYNFLRDHGALQTTLAGADLNALTNVAAYNALMDGLKARSLSVLATEKPETAVREVGRLLAAAWAQGDMKAVDLYQLSDLIYQIAAFRVYRKRGLTQEEAFLDVRDLFFDYGLVHPVVRFLRSGVPFASPFLTWTWKASGLVVNRVGQMVVLHRNPETGEEFKVPHLLFMSIPLLAAAALQSIAESALEFLDMADEEDRELLRVGLPRWSDGGLGFVLDPFNPLDAEGRPQWLDLGQYYAATTLVRLARMADDVRTRTDDPNVIGKMLKELGFGGDVASQFFMGLLTNRNPQTNQPIGTVGATIFEDVPAYGAFIWNIMAPPLLRITDDPSHPILGTNGVRGAITGAYDATPDLQGTRPVLNPTQNFLRRVVGYPVYVTDPLPMAERRLRDTKIGLSAVNGELNRLARSRNRGELTTEQAADRAEEILMRRERMLDAVAEAEAHLAAVREAYPRYRAEVRARVGYDPFVDDLRQSEQAKGERTTEAERERFLRELEAFRQ